MFGRKLESYSIETVWTYEEGWIFCYLAWSPVGLGVCWPPVPNSCRWLRDAFFGTKFNLISKQKATFWTFNLESSKTDHILPLQSVLFQMRETIGLVPFTKAFRTTMLLLFLKRTNCCPKCLNLHRVHLWLHSTQWLSHFLTESLTMDLRPNSSLLAFHNRVSLYRAGPDELRLAGSLRIPVLYSSSILDLLTVKMQWWANNSFYGCWDSSCLPMACIGSSYTVAFLL